MTMLENGYPTACVIKTSKNVTARMMLPMWNRERHGLTMPTNKAAPRYAPRLPSLNTLAL